MLRWRTNTKPKLTEDKEYQIRHEIGELKRQLQNFVPKGEIMMCTSHDPFADHCYKTAYAVLDFLRNYPKVTLHLRVCSKKLSRIIPIAIQEHIPENAIYGATITTLDIKEHEKWITADTPLKQIEAIRTLNALGYRTWLSLEPCFSGMNIPKILEMVPFVEKVAIGKHNRVANDPHEYDVLTKRQFREQIDLAKREFPHIEILVKKELDYWLYPEKRPKKRKRNA
jgi:DNA repair photolyase